MLVPVQCLNTDDGYFSYSTLRHLLGATIVSPTIRRGIPMYSHFAWILNGLSDGKEMRGANAVTSGLQESSRSSPKLN